MIGALHTLDRLRPSDADPSRLKSNEFWYKIRTQNGTGSEPEELFHQKTER